MNYDPERYAKTAFDVLGPAQRLLQILECQLKELRGPMSDLVLVDFGSGPGNTVQMLSDKFPTAKRIIGIDIDAKMVSYAQQHYQSDKFTFVEQDLGAPWSEWPPELTQWAGKVDAIFSNYTMHWLDEQAESMAINLANLLRPGGLFVADLLYCGDLSKVCTSEDQLQWLRTEFNLPNEQQFVSKFVFAFRDAGFRSIQLKYDEPVSYYPELEYRQNFINIPVRWYRNHMLPSSSGHQTSLSSEQIDTRIKDLLSKLRIQRVFPDPASNDGTNLAELKQILWTITLFKDGA